MAKELQIGDFSPSGSWIARILAENEKKMMKHSPNRKTFGSQDKRKPFVRLSFGEKYEISQFILKNSKWPVRAYAEHFSKVWNRNITQK